ncbi:hypothetical protein CHRYSEOSP005_28570 [Chryseobacterium sp. Alg-005]|uniref:T9SS type A sorting domain-containing protein n=1 Tax=Chryseobacterium sp. Alg-005 TaxID=3159516 RepID=UPI0035557B5E
MKKIYYILLLFIGLNIPGQPTIPASHGGYIGTLSYHHADNTLLGSLSPGPSGANVTWNFSQYSSVATTSQTTYNCPGNSNCSDFPAANKLNTPGGNSYSYQLFSNNEISTIGGKNTDSNGTTLQIFDDYKLEQKYPIVYQQTFTDTWSDHSSPAGTTNTGTLTVTVDAYGTLITPLGTYPNTLRIKRVQNITTNVTGNPTMTVYSEAYSWISPNHIGALLVMTFNDVTLTGYPTNHTRSFTFGDNGTLSTTDIDLDKQIDIYPNPASDFISIHSKEPIRNVLINNIEGKFILQSDKKDRIDISAIPAGIYFIKAELKSGKSITKKIIKQ